MRNQLRIDLVPAGRSSVAVHPSPPRCFGVASGDERGTALRNGFLKGHRLAAEALVPIYQDLNGVGMDRDYSVVVGWQKAF